jgi:thioredoxin reductase (NADPH)
MPADDSLQCVIIGGGPAGLSAAIYLSRFRRRVLVADAGQSRAAIIPRTRNVPGFPEGIAGATLLDLMRDQASRYGAQFLRANVIDLARDAVGFRVKTDAGQYTASAILFASGVENIVLDFAGHDEAVARGKLRYCPICDGYEMIGKRIAIVGNSARIADEREFLRTYTDDLALFAADEPSLAAMRSEGVEIDEHVRAVRLVDDATIIKTASGQHRFDSLYSCLGLRSRSALASRLGVTLDQAGAIVTDRHQRSNIPFVYGAGDVVAALDQIAVAIGHAAIAATTIHNDLRAC